MKSLTGEQIEDVLEIVKTHGSWKIWQKPFEKNLLKMGAYPTRLTTCPKVPS